MSYDEPFYRRSTSSQFDPYTTRLLVGVLGSLGLVVLLFNVPLSSAPQEIGWRVQRAAERIPVQEIQEREPPTERADTPEQAPPPTQHGPRTDKSSSGDGSSNVRQETAEKHSHADTSASPVTLAALSTEDAYPRIVGGSGALYLNINYPPEALRKRIEGRLELTFTVTKEGDVRQVRVSKSLHPLCDSAAVEGLRSVRFKPAKRNGEAVPVRMSLPVRFRLQSSSDLPLQSRRNASSEG